jgi:hypothetical protein
VRSRTNPPQRLGLPDEQMDQAACLAAGARQPQQAVLVA